MYYHKDGSSYEGQWERDEKNNSGTMVFSNGDRYTGQMLDGERSGQGRYEYENGDAYEGKLSLRRRSFTGLLAFVLCAAVDRWPLACAWGQCLQLPGHPPLTHRRMEAGQKARQGHFGHGERGQIRRRMVTERAFPPACTFLGPSSPRVHSACICMAGSLRTTVLLIHSNSLARRMNGKKHGVGQYLFANGDIYEGYFQNGYR